jgi:FAD synthase
VQITTVDEAKRFYPLFGLGANVALIFSGRTVKYFSNMRQNLGPGVDGWAISLKGMMSIGFRPTVDGKQRVIEVNLFNFASDIYDKHLTVYLKKYLREEVKFDGLESLVKQIDQDKKDSLNCL